MFLRVKQVRPKKKTYSYLQLVESRRVDGQPRQRVVETVMKLGERSPAEVMLIADAFARFLKKHGHEQTAKNLDSVAGTEPSRHFGDVAAVESAWRELGLDRIIERLAEGRKFAFSLERAVFAMVAQRLIDPASKLACIEWLNNDVYVPSALGLDEDDLYATLSWLDEVSGAIETRLFEKLDREGRLDTTAVFYDTTATWFEGRGPEELADFGRPKGGQPAQRRIVLLGLVRSREGWPILHKVFPGNRNDATTVKEIVTELKTRLGITRCVFVGDRGMVSDEIIQHIEKLGLQYVLAVKLRSLKEVREEVLTRAGRYQVVRDNLEVKEVLVDGRRYVVCRNPHGEGRDRNRRDDILSRLEKELKGGVLSSSQRGADLRANRAYSRYLATEKGMLVIDRRKADADGRYDGKWVIRTNVVEEESAVLAELYKSLNGIEHDFRDIKSFIELRPVRHRTEPRVRAHVFVCVLAKAVMTALERRLEKNGKKPFTVEKALKALGRVQATAFLAGDQRIWVRTNLNEKMQQAADALGLSAHDLPRSLGSETIAT